MKSWCRPVVALVLVALLVAACSSGAEVASVDGPPSSPGEVDSAAADSAGEAKTLDDYLGVAAGFVRRDASGPARGAGASFDDEQFAEEQRLIQQEIQACMQAQGFTYVPEQETGGFRVFLAGENQGVSPREYAETQGFGISTRFDAVLEGEVDFGDADNPNDDHVATLSEGEADAWQLALNGSPPVRNDEGQLVDPETGEVLQGRPGRAAGGCTAQAQTSVRGDLSALAELADDFAELDERIAADPRIAEIRRDWAECMRAAGFGYEDEAEARQDVTARVRPFLLSLFGRGAGQGQGGDPGNPLQQPAAIELTAEQDAELRALQDLERSIAVASLDCSGDTATEVEEITAGYEADFVEANRAILDSIGS